MGMGFGAVLGRLFNRQEEQVGKKEEIHEQYSREIPVAYQQFLHCRFGNYADRITVSAHDNRQTIPSLKLIANNDEYMVHPIILSKGKDRKNPRLFPDQWGVTWTPPKYSSAGGGATTIQLAPRFSTRFQAFKYVVNRVICTHFAEKAEKIDIDHNGHVRT